MKAGFPVGAGNDKGGGGNERGVSIIAANMVNNNKLRQTGWLSSFSENNRKTIL